MIIRLLRINIISVIRYFIRTIIRIVSSNISNIRDY